MRRGVVASGAFDGEHVKSAGFAITPVKGDCGSEPLVHAKLVGTLEL